MSHQVTSEGVSLVGVALEVSSLLATASPETAPYSELGPRLTTAVARRLNASRVEMVLETGGERPLAAEWVATPVHPRRTAPFFLCSRPLSIRGRDRGRLEVHLSEPVGRPAQLLQALEVVGTLLGLWAEIAELSYSRRRLAAETDAARARLAHDKIMARAAGIVAERAGLSRGEAERWLHSEALRTATPLLTIADRIVLHRQAETGRAARAPLRKTA